MTPGEQRIVDVVVALLERMTVAMEKIANLLETVLTAADGWGHLLKMLIDLAEAGEETDEHDPGTAVS